MDDDLRAHGRTDVEVGIFSMSARSPDGTDAAYLEWHGLDHLPEQYRMTGMRNGTRWVSTPECRAARAASDARFDAVDHLVAYLFAGTASLPTFFALGATLREGGRMPLRLPSVELAGYRLVDMAAGERALVGADVLPWRPTRGAYVLIESGAPSRAGLLDVPGVAGYWQFAGTAELDDRLAATTGLTLTLCYLDDDPVAVADAIKPTLSGSTLLLAAPFITVVPWAWDRALPE